MDFDYCYLLEPIGTCTSILVYFQVLLPLLKTDLYEVMQGCVNGTLANTPLSFSQDQHVVAVVLVSEGYPGSYKKGYQITSECPTIGPTILRQFWTPILCVNSPPHELLTKCWTGPDPEIEWVNLNQEKWFPMFLSPPVQFAQWAHMYHFLSVCPSVCLSGLDQKSD